MSAGHAALDLTSIEERLGSFRDPDRSAGGSAYTELYFSPKPRREDAPPVLVFQHIRKTAGTSFRQVLRKNLKKHPALAVPSLRHGANAEGTERTRENLIEWHRELYGQLSAEEWAQLSCVTSHEASYFLPLLQTPALGFTLVREPVDRVISRYYFANRPPKQGTERKRERGIGPGIGEELREWSLEQIYERVGGSDPATLDRSYAFGAFFNGQSRSLLEPHFDISELTFSDGPPADAALWRARLTEILDRHYLLGVSERFDEGVAAVAERYGWKTAGSARKKVNTTRPATAELPAELRELVAGYNWLDLELYGRAVERSDERLHEGGPPLPIKRNKQYHRAAKLEGERIALEVYLTPEPLPAEVPTVVFQHIPKTAGTSLRDVIHRNYAADAEHRVISAASGEDRATAAKRYFEGLTERERSSLACVVGHPANHLLYMLERPRRAITIVREPVDRVLSRFHFGGKKRGNAGVPHNLKDLFTDPARLAEEESGLSRQYVNGQSRMVLDPLFDVDVPALASSEGPPPDADVWRTRLFEALEADYLVGVQERFDRSVMQFAGELGWREVAAPRAKVNRSRPSAAAEDQDLLSRARTYNWLDAELYARALEQPGSAAAGARPVKRSKDYQRAVKRGVRGSTFEVYFAREPLPPEQPTVVFQHIEKTAGTSIRDLIYRNYSPTAKHAISEIPRGEDRAAWCAAYYEGLSADERQSVLCVLGHPANHLMYRIDRPFRAITMLREPVDRVLSRFHFGGSKRADSHRPTLEQLLANPDRLAATSPDLSRRYVNGQARALLAPLFDIDASALACSTGPPPEAGLWRERLFEALDADYLVGVQERFEQSVLRFATEFGWTEAAAPRTKVNHARPPAAEEDQALLTRIRDLNWLDVELYERVLAQAAAPPGDAGSGPFSARRTQT